MSEDALRDACILELSPRRERTAQDRLLDNSRKERDGQIDPDTIVDTDGKPMNQDQRESYALELLAKGYTPKEVNTKLSKIPRAEE